MLFVSVPTKTRVSCHTDDIQLDSITRYHIKCISMLGKLGTRVKLFPAIAAAVGCLLVLGFTTRHLPDFVKSMTLKVEHPANYAFTTYDGVLKKYVKDGLVDYGSMKKDPDLSKAVSELEVVSPDKIATAKERACFWINACNLLTLKVINDHYPVTSTDQLTPFWSQNSFIIGGDSTSVSSTMNRAINELKDSRMAPNTAFLICKGSVGYPPLTDHAITPETMEADAKVATYKFVNNEQNVFYDQESNQFLLSPLFKRYEQFIRRANMEPHKYALLQMNTNRLPDLTDLMLTKTYFAKIEPKINDTSLSSNKEKE